MHYDPGTGRLDVCPATPAYATQMRLLGQQMIARINDKTDATVRSLHVLPPGAPAAAAPAPAPAATAVPQDHRAPARTREMASDGYRRALAAHQAARPQHHLQPDIAAPAAEAQMSRRMQGREELFISDQDELADQHAARNSVDAAPGTAP